MAMERSQEAEIIRSYQKGHDKQSVVRLLFDFIVQCANEGDFTKASTFREKLIALDPSATDEIMRSGEIIEEKKKKCLWQYKVKTFSKLDSALNSEERKALSQILKEHTYGSDTCVFKQGDLNFNLYLIDAGQLKMTFNQEGREMLLRTLVSGDIAGDDTFFSISVCTTSLITLSAARIYTLDRKDLTRLRDRVPTLESRLIHYCQGLETVYQLLAKKRLERRVHKRVKLSGSATLEIRHSVEGLFNEPIAGQLSDISAGGVAVLCEMTEDLDPRKLLGRKLNIAFDLSVGTVREGIDKTGTVVAISRPPDLYRLHIRFDELLSEKTVDGIEQATVNL